LTREVRSGACLAVKFITTPMNHNFRRANRVVKPMSHSTGSTKSEQANCSFRRRKRLMSQPTVENHGGNWRLQYSPAPLGGERKAASVSSKGWFGTKLRTLAWLDFARSPASLSSTHLSIALSREMGSRSIRLCFAGIDPAKFISQRSGIITNGNGGVFKLVTDR